MSTPDIDCSRRRPPQALIHTPHSPSLQRGEEREGSRLAALPWLGFSVSEFKLASGGARAPALQVWRGGACRWLGGAEATWSHLPGPRWRTCSSPPGRCGEGGQVAWRGAKPPGATRAVTWPQAAFGIYSRCFLHLFAHGHRRRKPSAPGAFCTVLPMSTGGVSHLLQVLFALFCPCPQAA